LEYNPIIIDFLGALGYNIITKDFGGLLYVDKKKRIS
jgi:hypothetical protein